MQFIKKILIIITLSITASLLFISCAGSGPADQGAPSRRTNAVIIGGTDTTNPITPQAYAWINGAAFPLGDGINPSEIFMLGVSKNGPPLFIGYQNNGSIDKAFFWIYENEQFITSDIGQGSLAGYSSRANCMRKLDRYLYVSGQYKPGADWGAILWRCDLIERAVVSTTILDITQIPASANGINHSTNPGGLASGFVTIGGFKRACYWLDPTTVTPNISVIGTAGSNSEGVISWMGGVGVITLGYQNDGTYDRACIWNGPTLINFGTAGRNSRPFRIFQEISYGAGTDTTLYFVGYETNAAGRDVACYWIWTGSAARHDLGIATRDSRALMVWTFEGNLYATGYEYSADGQAVGTKEACMWINGAKTVLSPGRAGTGNFIWDPYFTIDED